MRQRRYTADLAKRMYLFFLAYDDDRSAPSVDKFARSIGATAEDVENFRRHEKFDRAYRECTEIRRDYLTDRALCKRFDPSFVKFLLGEDTPDKTDDSLSVQLEVLSE